MKKPSLALIPSGYRAGKVYSILPNDGVGDFTFSRGSSATRVNKDGLIETVLDNIPRLDYSDNGCPSLLLEPSRTNYVPNQNVASYAQNQADVTLSNNPSPDGTINCFRVEGTSSGLRVGEATFNVVIGNTYTGSVYVRKVSGSDIAQIVDVDFAAPQSINITTEWQRFDITKTATQTTGRIFVNVNQVGDVIEVFGFQIEEGSYASSYIPTIGIISTRNNDLCISGGNNSLFNVNKLSLFVDVTNFSDTDFSYITLTDGQSSPINMIRLAYTEDQIQIRGFDDGSRVLNYNITSVVPNQKNKVLLTFDNSEAKIYFNGVFLTTEPTVTIPLGLDSLTFTNRTENGSFFKGKVHDVRFYDTVLTEAEAIELTTL